MRNIKQVVLIRIICYLQLISVLIISCSDNERPPLSFYYWKQSFSLSKEQQNILKETKVKRLFVRFFDVILDKNNQPKPNSKINFKHRTNLEVVPCVFIQNEVFSSHKDFKSLAKKITKLIREIAQHQHLRIKEIQIDCDWTEGTRNAYFAFLNEMHHEANWSLICTIRLHQIKYQTSAGIPPVQKGLLMCYNMDDIDDLQTPNSILSPSVLKTYVNENTTYPLKLDLAFPIYQWGLIFRLGKLSVISNDLSLDDLNHTSIKRIGKNVFLVKKNVIINETYLCKGDLLRHETSELKELFQSATIFKQINITFDQLIFYHLSQNHLNSYDAASLSEINRLIP